MLNLIIYKGSAKVYVKFVCKFLDHTSKEEKSRTVVHSQSATSVLSGAESGEESDDKWVCQECRKTFVQENAQVLECDRCRLHYCCRCVKISRDEYKVLSKRPDLFWFCPPCAIKTRASIDKEISLENLSRDMTEKMLGKFSEMEERIQDSLLETITTRFAAFEENVETKLKSTTEGSKQGKSSWAELFKTSADQKNCDVAKTIARAAVQEQVKESKGREDRDSNLIIFRVKESNKAEPELRQVEDLDFVNKLFEEKLEVGQINIDKTVRLGKKEEEKNRPLKVILQDKQDKRKIMASLYKLQYVDDTYKNISVQNDMSLEERDITKKLLAEAKAKNEAEESKEYVYKVGALPGTNR